MLHGRKTWPMKQSEISKFARTNMKMVCWMCHASLRDRKSSEDLPNRLGIGNITNVLHQTTLRWFEHVESMDKENLANSCRFIEVGGQREKAETMQNMGKKENVASISPT